MSHLFDITKNLSTTENGSLCFNTIGSNTVSFFSKSGAIRNSTNKEIETIVKEAWMENPVETLAILFYTRDIRKGLGEKHVFIRGMLTVLNCIENDEIPDNFSLVCNNANDAYLKYSELLKPIYEAIIEFGCWKDLFTMYTRPDANLFQFIKEKIDSISDDKTDIMFKWLPSIGGSSNKYAEELASYLEMTPKQYRKLLSKKRSMLDIVESKMCSNDWNIIDYEHVPSKAALLHGKAFRAHDNDRYNNYIQDVSNGKKQINTKTIFPYEIANRILKMIENSKSYNHDFSDVEYNFSDEDITEINRLETIWKNLPNTVNQNNGSTLIIADTSASMLYGSPSAMSVSTSLAIYFSERDKSIFNNEFVTFSRNPYFYKFVDSDTLFDKIKKMYDLNICENTDINKTFKVILKRAVMNNLKQEEMPKNVIIISDMQFDSGTAGETNFESIRKMYKESGYIMPQLVFWNVNSRGNVTPVTMNEKGVILVSGCSPNVFNMILSGDLDPYKFMLQTINKDRYMNYVNQIVKKK